MSVSLKRDAKELHLYLEDSVGEAINKKVKVDSASSASVLDERLKNMEKLLLQCINQFSGNTLPLFQWYPGDGSEID